MNPTRIIDFHQHVFWHKRDDAALVRNLDEHGIAQAVLLNWDLSALEGASSWATARTLRITQ